MFERYRIRWTKEGRARFISARDLTSVWERSIRRADLPIAYSEGFTPHPKVSFPDALPVGVRSTGEYAELSFAAPIEAGRDLAALSAELPAGMDITTYLRVPDGAPKLAKLLQVTLWELRWPPVDAAELSELLAARSAALLAEERREVVRHRPDGDRTIDVRPAIVALAATTHLAIDGPGAATTLRAVLRNDGMTVRPTDLHAALSEGDIAEPVAVRRVVQGAAVDGGVADALDDEVEPLVPNVEPEAA